MINSKIYIGGTIIFLFLSCNTAKNDNKNIASVVFTKDLMLQQGLDHNDTNYIQSSRCVALEVTDESLLAKISSLQEYKENFYIYDNKINKVLRFDEDGSFVCRYGRRGGGPGEYVSISGFYVDPYREEVALFDHMAGKVHRYTLDGQYISSVPSPEGRLFTYLGNCKMLNSEEVVCQVNPNCIYSYCCILLNRSDYSIKRVFSAYVGKTRVAEDLNNTVFSICGDKISCVKLFSDTISVFDKDTVCYEIISRSLPEMTHKNILQKVKKEGFIGAWINTWKEKNFSPGLTAIYETSRWRYIDVPYQKDLHSAILTDKKNNRSIVISGITPTFFWDMRDIVGQGENTFIKVLNGSSLEKIPTEKLMENSPECWDKIAKTYPPAESNPLLVIYKMRE